MAIQHKKVAMEHDKKIALVAHDNKKHDLVEWAKFNRDLLAHHLVYATDTTGTIRGRRTGFPLEGALRERNALQVIQLSRQYTVDKQRRTEDYEDDKAERAREYKERLADLKEQLNRELEEAARAAAERNQQLKEELDERLATIAAERKAEAEQAKLDNEQKLAEEEARWQEENTKIAEKLNEGLQLIRDLLITQYGLTEDEADAALTRITANLAKTGADGFGEFWAEVSKITA